MSIVSQLSLIWCFLLVIIVNSYPIDAAHVHVHEKHAGEDALGGHRDKHNAHNKEKVEDAWNSVHYKDGEHRDEFDHEAVLGDRKTASEFDGLAPDESKRRLRLLVTRDGMDADHDGFVDTDELTAWVVKSFKSLAEEDGLDRFEDEDLDVDGYVTWKEHLKDNFDTEDETGDITNDSENLRMIAEDRELWRAADQNGDNKLDRSEFPPFNTPEEFGHMHEALFALTMLRRDKNKDGNLDLMEFLVDDNGQLPDQRSDTYLSERDKFEMDYDRNKDGKLDKTEILSWIIPDNQ